MGGSCRKEQGSAAGATRGRPQEPGTGELRKVHEVPCLTSRARVRHYFRYLKLARERREFLLDVILLLSSHFFN